MTHPTTEQANGYDLMVWIAEDGSVLTKPFTLMGEVVLRGMFKSYDRGDVLEILCQPEEFTKEIPPSATVGYIDPRTNKVYEMSKNRLQ